MMSRLGSQAIAATERRKELAQDAPGPEVLGTIAADSPLTNPTPTTTDATWASDTGTVAMTEPPPPWELDGDVDMSDARKYVQVPDNWTLRWVNPRLLDQFGWRHWQPVSSSDSRVKVTVKTMIATDGLIRRGGATGDILAWMYTSWVTSARAALQRKTDEQAASAVNKQAELREEFRRGTYGPHVRLEEARHPSHTMAEGRSMRD